MTSAAPELSIVIFAFNEAENIGPVLRELRAWLDRHEPRTELVVVDDGSRDDTLEEARRALAGSDAQFFRHDRNRGIGAALKTGVVECNAPWITFLPADGQIEPAAIGTLRDAARDENCDVVFSTYADRDDGAHRRLLSAGVRGLILLVHGVRMRSDGPYLFRRELFDPKELAANTFFLNFEFPIRAIARGVRTRNVEIRCRPRRAGASKSTGLRRIAGVGRDLIALRVRRSLETLTGHVRR